MSEPTFDWIGLGDNGDDAYVSITRITEHAPGRAVWEISTDGIDRAGQWVELDDDAVSAWSTVAHVMCENGATGEHIDAMVQAAPDVLVWCFDGQVGMYAYDKNEEWDG